MNRTAVRAGRNSAFRRRAFTEVSAAQAGWVAWHERWVFVTCGCGAVGLLFAMPAILAQRPVEPAAAPNRGGL